VDNASIHCNARIEELITSHIELSFSVLKAWVRRHFHEIWLSFEGSFGEFLHYAVARSRCDRFPRQHFKHSAGGYILEADIKALERDLEAGSLVP